MQRQHRTSNKTVVKDRIKRRRALYRSLEARGYIKGDPSLKPVNGSVFDSMLSYIRETPIFTPERFEGEAENWYNCCSIIYDDPQLTPPDGWNEFIETLVDFVEVPEDYYSGNATPLLMEALEAFPAELMAIEMQTGFEDDTELTGDKQQKVEAPQPVTAPAVTRAIELYRKNRGR